MMPIDAAWSVLKAVSGQPLFPVKRHDKLPHEPGLQPGSSAAFASPLSYYGRKGWLVPQLREDFEPFRDTHSFHDIFGGSGQAIMGVNPKQGSWNDPDEPLSNFMRHLKRGLTIPDFGPNTKENFYRLVSRYNHVMATDPTSREAAQLYWALNKRGRMGAMEHNLRGEFNTPWGGFRPEYERQFDLTPIKRPMHRWKIQSKDFRDVMRGLDDDAFAYLDPPYDKRHGRYGQGGFKDELQRDVRDVALAHPGPVMVSNYATPEMLDLYEDDFDIETIDRGARANLIAGAHGRKVGGTPQEMIARRIDE